MPRVQVGLVDGPVGMECGRLRVELHGSPEVRDVGVEIINGLDPPGMGPGEEDGRGVAKRLDEVHHVPEPLPDEGGDPRFPTESRHIYGKGALSGALPVPPFWTLIRSS